MGTHVRTRAGIHVLRLSFNPLNNLQIIYQNVDNIFYNNSTVQVFSSLWYRQTR